MTPENFKESNYLLSAGSNEDCNDLVVGRAIDSHGYECFVAKFKLSEQEIERINETGELWLSNRGVWPPVLPTVFHPYNELGYKPINNG